MQVSEGCTRLGLPKTQHPKSGPTVPSCGEAQHGRGISFSTLFLL